jgi:ATP-binding cassette subfamily B multidrug efflux pump
VKPVSAGRMLLRCYRYLRPYRRIVGAAYLFLLAINGMNLIIPQIVRAAVDRGMEQGDTGLLVRSVAGLLALTLFKGVLSFAEGCWVEQASQGVAYDLRNAIHQKLASLSFSYHDRAETGQLLSRSVQDVERIRFLTGRATLRLMEGATLLLGTTVALVQMNPTLALMTLLSMPLLVERALAFSRQFRPLSLAIQNQLGVLTTRLEQNLRGARVVKAFAQETAEMERFEAENTDWFGLSALSARIQAINTPLMTLIGNASMVLIIWYGGLLAIRGQLTLGELVAFSTYLSLLAEPARRLGMVAPAIVMAMSAGERIFEILDAESGVQEAADARPLPPVEGNVHFENVSFAYFHQRVLDRISFEAHPGQVIALLGATGSGKSTIINLVPRFYDPVEGHILIDGWDIREVTLSSLREQIAIVLQETTLFASSVRENIAFGRPAATEQEIVAAAQAAQAHDFIEAMPYGYDTRVGERGVTLSGGQKQRIAIARALLKDPRILILDDATSSVDSETEQQIQRALERLMRGRTSFVIAQRLSTVRQADVILVLEKGHIAARGTHEELLRTSGLYAEIYHHQLMRSDRER